MIKKIIISTLVILSLTSCGAPKIENPNDALSQNQKIIIEKLEKIVNITPDEGVSKGVINLGLEAKEGELKSKIKYNFDFIQKEQKSSGNLDIDIETKVKDKNISPIQDLSGNINLDLISLKNKVLFKLNELKINNIEKNPNLAIIPGIANQFQKKWYFLEIPENNNINFDTNLLIKNQKEIIKVLKNNKILEFVKENENQNFYDYDVKLNSKNIISAIKEINKLTGNTKKELSKEEISEIEKNIDDFNKNIQTNIKIDKNNLEYFVLVFKNKDGNLKITNNKENFNINLENNLDKLNINILGKKINDKKLETKINILEENKNIFDGTANFEIAVKNTKVNFTATANNAGEELKINFSIDDNTTKKSVKIEEPKESINFEEIIKGFMGTMMGGGMNMQINNVPQTQINTNTGNTEK